MAQNNIQSQIDLLQQTQIQSLSPQQVLTARLTELSIEALRQRVDNECMENPWLEKKEETGNGPDDYENTASSEEEEGEVVYGERPYESTEDDNASVYGSKDDIPAYQLYTQNGDNTPENIEYGDTQSFFDKLESQIYEYDLTSDQREKLKYLIGSLGDDGLLHKPLYQIADEVEIYQGLQTTEEEMQQLLKVLWQFDPLGVGARSVQECLLIQIRHDKGNPLQPLMERLFIGGDCHASAAVRAESREVVSLSAGTDRHTVCSPDLNKRLSQQEPLLRGDLPGLRKITPCFLIQVDKADHCCARISGQRFGHILKRFEMTFNGILITDEDRIIPPSHAVHANCIRQAFETLQHIPFVRNVRFDLFPVWRNCHKPVLPIGTEQVHMRKHRRRILRAEADQIHHIRRQPVSCDGTRVVGISYQHKSRLQPVHEPVRIEGRNICAHSCVDDHDTNPLMISAESPLMRMD